MRHCYTYLFSNNLSGAIYWRNNDSLLFWTTVGRKICTKTNQPLQIINFAKETFASVFKSKKRARKAKAKRKKRTADKECTGQPKLAADEQKNIEQKNMLLITRYVLMLVIISSLQNSLEV